MDDKNKVIIIEPVIKSNVFLNYLKKLITNILHENKISLSSIKKDGFYCIIEIKKNDQIVFTMDLLSKVSGIAYAFVAKSSIIDYNILSQTIIQIGKKVVLKDEKFFVIIAYSEDGQGKKKEFSSIKKDLEFFVISELSSVSLGIRHVKNECEADKTLFVLIGRDFAYVSLLLKRGKETMPFKFLKETVACPIHEEYSFLSLVSVLDNGFFPIPLIFYKDENQLIKSLKAFEKIVKRYPIKNITLNLFNLNDINSRLNEFHSKNNNDSNQDKEEMMKALLFDEVIVKISLQSKIDANFICIPFLPFLHPFWFIKKNILVSFESGKIPLTPFLFNYKLKNNLGDFYSCRTDGARQKPLGPNSLFLEVTSKEYESYYKKTVNVTNTSSSKEIRKFILDAGKDDILDVINSI
jgi:hypothetical protein